MMTNSLKQQQQSLAVTPFSQQQLLPSPMLSPSSFSASLTSDEDSVYSPSTIVDQNFQLDDLFDWDGNQSAGAITF